MKNTDINEALNEVDEEYIKSSFPSSFRENTGGAPARRVRRSIRIIAVAVAVALIAVAVIAAITSQRAPEPGVTSAETQGPTSTSPRQESSGETSQSADESSSPVVSDHVESSDPAETSDPPAVVTPSPYINNKLSDELEQNALAAPSIRDSVWNPIVMIPTSDGLPAQGPRIYAEVDGYDDASRAYLEWQDSLITTDVKTDAAAFAYSTAKRFLTGTDGENRVYSPVNIYLALAMLAEITDGDTRAQIMSLLGADDVTELREKAASTWASSFTKDGLTTSEAATSMWLREGYDYKTEVLKTLAEKYFAASFEGEMGSEEYTALLRKWLNEKTGGLLEDSLEELEVNPLSVMVIAATVQFCAQWGQFSYIDETDINGIFHTPGGDKDCLYMHFRSDSDIVAFGNYFTAISRDLQGGSIAFLIPDEGYSVDEILADPAVEKIYASPVVFGGETVMDDAGFNTTLPIEGLEYKSVILDLTMPKFDVSADMDFIGMLQSMGVTDCFDREKANFTPLTDEPSICVTDISGSSRVIVDEIGVRAGSYVMVSPGALGGPVDVLKIVMDRPFVFIVANQRGIVMMTGVVNDPGIVE